MKIRFIRTVRDGRYDFRAGDANGFVQAGKARRDAELAATDSVSESTITAPKKSAKIVRDVE